MVKRSVMAAALGLAFACAAGEPLIPGEGGLAGAAAEFARYYAEITGRAPEAGLLRLGVDPSVSKTGRDAYTIRSEEDGVRVTGSNVRSVYYGVYDLLERRGGCHWFWDGDVVPKHETVDLAGLDVTESAQFEYRGLRYFAHRGLTRFQAEHWGPADWKREIDWLLKRRLNLFILRIGQDDLFQRAFPGVCAYPDASKELPGHGKGYDNRSLFWSLEYRGKLRDALQKYGRERGLIVPEDFGTMTHWYSRTPEDYLAAKKPTFLPQATEGYSERNGLVWDIREQKWVDEYWQLTKAAVRTYAGGQVEMLHTPGLGERRCFKDRAKNFEMKVQTLDLFLNRAHTEYPDAKVMIAGWDFYFTWQPEEVQGLLKHLDPKRDIIWDYEGDATRDYRPEMTGVFNDFTKWGVVGKYPYTYSVFLAFEDALDMRANYPLIEKRQKIVQNDPFCKGYVFWPESSHTDTLLLRHWTANAWSREQVRIPQVLDEYCASRYAAADAAKLKAVWEKAIPVSSLLDWNGNYAKYAVARGKFRPEFNEPKDDAEFWKSRERKYRPAVTSFEEILRGLRDVAWSDAFVRRDTVDLLRMAVDRRIIAENAVMMDAFLRWKAGQAAPETVIASAERYAALGAAMAKVLALHTDYSIWESFERLNAVERVANPKFPEVLLENALCGYCASHQYEAAEWWFKPVMRDTATKIIAAVKSGNRQAKAPDGSVYAKGELDLRSRKLQSLRPTLPRTPKNYRAVIDELLAITVAKSVQAPLATNARHEPHLVMGRAYWTWLGEHPYTSPYYASRTDRWWGTWESPWYNQALTNVPCFRDCAIMASTRHPPPDSKGLKATWRTVAENCGPDKRQRGRVLGNHKPDRPFALTFDCKRNVNALVGEIELDHDDWVAYKRAHPNLIGTRTMCEWGNDLLLSIRRTKEILNPSRRAELDALFARYEWSDPTSRLALYRWYADFKLKTHYDDMDTFMAFRALYCLDHVAAAWGAKTLTAETTDTSSGDDEYRWDVSGMFIRGAARQFALPWCWYEAAYYNGPTKDGGWMNNSVPSMHPHGKNPPHPERGISQSHQRRVWYYAYLNGANGVESESWSGCFFTTNTPTGKAGLSDRGRNFSDFHDFTVAHPNRGITYAPVAILTPFDLFYTQAGCNYGTYRPGDYAVDAVIATIVPGRPRAAELKRGVQEGNLHNSRFAMMYDVLVPDSPQPKEEFRRALFAYPAAILAGEYAHPELFEDVLTDYVRAGGRLIRITPEMLPPLTNANAARAGVKNGSLKFPKVAAELERLQTELFPFAVAGDCQYGANKTEKGWWLWIFNNRGVRKFADTMQTIDRTKDAPVTVSLGSVRAKSVTELLSGKTVPLADGRFAATIPAGDLAVFEIE